MGFASGVLKEVWSTLRTAVGIVCVLVLAYVAWQIWFAQAPDRGFDIARVSATPPLAASIGLEIAGARTSSSIVSVDLVVTNRSDRWADVYVDCAFLRSGAVIGDTAGSVSSLGPGASVRETVRWAARGQRYDDVECRVSGAYGA